MEEQFGLPVVRLGNLESFLSDSGIHIWPLVAGTSPMSLEQYLAPRCGVVDPDDPVDVDGLHKPAPDQILKSQADRWAPKVEVLLLQQPGKKDGWPPFHGFRAIHNVYTCTFTLLPGDLVLLVAEFKHGANRVIISPPCGSLPPGTNDLTELTDNARAEVEQETGIVLSDVQLLSSSMDGLATSGTNSTGACVPFLGLCDDSVTSKDQHLDPNEQLAAFLMPLSDWMIYLFSGQVQALAALSTSMLALRRLGKLHY